MPKRAPFVFTAVVKLFAVSLLAVALHAVPLRAAEPKEKEWTEKKHLQVAGQPLGKDLAKRGDEVYRFMLTDAGLTSSDIVVVARHGTEYTLSSAEVDLHAYYGADGKDGGGKEGVEKTERKLTAEEWNAITARFKTLDFWKMPDPEPRLVLDGTIWTLEAAAGKQYRAVTIHAPDAGPFRAAGLQLWRTSGRFMGFWADLKE